MKGSILIVITLLIVTTFPCCTREVGRYDLTEAQKNIIPYKKGQVISFIDSTCHSVELIVTSDELGRHSSDAGGEEGGAFADYVSLMSKSVELKNKTHNLDVYLYLTTVEGGECMLRIDTPHDTFFYLRFDREGNLKINYSDSFYESLKVKDKVYYHVIEQNGYVIYDRRYYDRDSSFIQLLYNKEYGILQVSIDDKNLLTLNN
jgi:hypothetical protein